MENFFARYKNPLVLMAVLFIQVVALATQVKRQETSRGGNPGGGTRLIRVWSVTAFTPVERMFVSTGHFFRDGWNNYANLRGVRKQNRDLQEANARLQMEQVRLKQDADQAKRLQALLDFKEKFIAKTTAAQVIATSGVEQSRVIYIDKGSHDGIRQDMAVITPDGVVGKIKDVFPLSSQVLLINDHDSGAGVILENSRLQGILKGTSLGELTIDYVTSDEKVEPGEHVITSGGDRIYPKGLSVGTVSSATPDRDNDPFLVIRVKPVADLHRLEEVLVITKVADESPAAASGPAPMRAADILAQRLPSVPKQDPNAAKTPGGAPAGSTSPTPAKKNLTGVAGAGPTGAGVNPGSLTGPAKPPASGAATATPATKTGVEASKPAIAAPKTAATGLAPTPTATPAAIPTPTPSPTPAQKKAKVPAAGPAAASPNPSGSKPADQAGSKAGATPAATPGKPPQ